MKDRNKRNALQRIRCANNRLKVNSYNRAWYANNRKTILSKQAVYRSLNRDKRNRRARELYALNGSFKRRENYLQNSKNILLQRRAQKYGIPLDELLKLISSRSGKCDLCRRPFGPKGPCVDHCHNHHHIRGILCTRCNVALGMFDHSEKILDAALKYLSREALFNPAI